MPLPLALVLVASGGMSGRWLVVATAGEPAMEAVGAAVDEAGVIVVEVAGPV